MDEMTKELWVALKALNGPQWIVLLTLALLLGIGLFFVFRWLYQARLDAQGSLIELKDKTIEHYKNVHIEKVTVKPLSEIVPEAWSPYLKQPFSLLEEFLEEAQAQQQMNRISADMGFLLDAELYILYLKIYYSLSPERAEAFRHEQEQWLRERKQYCEESVESHGGTLAPLEYGMAFVSRTQERIKEFEARVK